MRKNIDCAEFDYGLLSDRADLLIAEFAVHHLLYKGFANERTIFYGTDDFWPWEDHARTLSEVEKCLEICASRDIQHILFLTGFSFYWHTPQELSIFDRCGVGVHMLLHANAPDHPRTLASVNTLFDLGINFYVFAEECLKDYAVLDWHESIRTIPHPPILLKNARSDLKKFRQASRTITIGFLGEIRRNKGFAEAAMHFAALPNELKRRISCLFCGGVRDAEQFAAVQSVLSTSGVNADYVCKRIDDFFKVIGDNELETALLSSHIIIFPYYGYNEQCAFSGTFIDGLISGAVFIATRGSTMGRILEKYGLGWSYAVGDTDSFEAALRNAICAVESDSLAENRRKYLENYFKGDMNRPVQEYLGMGAPAVS